MHSFNNKKDGNALKELLNAIYECENDSIHTLHLTANENLMSNFCHSVLSSNLSYRYHLEDMKEKNKSPSCSIINRFVLKKLSGIQLLESKALDVSFKMFHAELSDFRPLSGMHAAISVIATATKPNDDIYVVSPSHGGHDITANAIEKLGRKVKFLPWDNSTHNIDIKSLKNEIANQKPAAIILNQSNPLFPFAIKEIKEAIHHKTLLIYDASHVFGLIAGGIFQQPLQEGCDILHGSTHKTFPGPQKAMIHYKERLFGLDMFDRIGKAMVSSQQTHHSIALYLSILEMSEFGNQYASQVVLNAKLLAQSLSSYGFNLFNVKNNFTESHIILIAFDSWKHCQQACIKLHNCNISTNTKIINDKFYIRIGVQEITRLGMTENEIKRIANFIKQAIIDNESSLKIRNQITIIKKQFNKIQYSFDD